MIQLLWREGDECIDPANSLKNLVYRARMLLDDLVLEDEVCEEGMEFIRFSEGAYMWNEDIPCEIDTEVMPLLAKRGSDEDQAIESRIACYSRKITSIHPRAIGRSARSNAKTGRTSGFLQSAHSMKAFMSAVC